MAKKNQEGLTVKKDENFSEWYTQIIQKAELADLRYNGPSIYWPSPWG